MLCLRLWIYIYYVIHDRYVTRMIETTIACSVVLWKPEGKIPLRKLNVGGMIILICILEK